MRNGRIVDGFVEAVDLCGNELAKNFPRAEDNRDELTNRIYLI
jgi:putative membrane protein